MNLTGDTNTPALPMTDAEVNHLRRLLAWMRCEWMLDENAQRGMLDAIEHLGEVGAITQERATQAVAERAEKINRCPAYVRQAVKMLTKALRDHERKAGIVDASKTGVEPNGVDVQMPTICSPQILQDRHEPPNVRAKQEPTA